MALSSDQLTDMQGDLGISGDASVFTDVELNRLFTRAESDYELAVYYGFRQLLAEANKFYNYTAGMTKVQRVQMRENLESSMGIWRDEARVAGNQVRLIGLRSIPPRYKDAPADVEVGQDSGFHDGEKDRGY